MVHPMTLEEVWRLREEQLYPTLFGPLSRGIFPLSQELFARQFSQHDIDPRWLFYGVLEYPPTEQRNSWLYATSGLSNPWDNEREAYDPSGRSGSGVEFVFPVSEQGDWAIRTLQSMLAFDLLLTAGRFERKMPLTLGDRIPLRAPLNGDPACAIRNLVVVMPEGFPADFSLPSGKVALLAFTGLTDLELDSAKTSGSAAVVDRLRIAGHHPVTDPNRLSLL
jgi:hypothetical protein